VTISEILGKARERGEQVRLPYAGALTPQEAYEIWRLARGGIALDAELTLVNREW